jgi:hypothetical protein
MDCAKISKALCGRCVLCRAQPWTLVGVCTENSDSKILVMQPADEGMRHDPSNLLNRPRDRRILVQ